MALASAQNPKRLSPRFWTPRVRGISMAGKAPLQRPRAHGNTRLAFMAPAHLVPCGVGLEESAGVRLRKEGISLEKFKCPSLAAWPHALLSSSCAKTMPQSSRCWLPPDIKDQDSLQFRTPRVTDWQRE